MAANIMSLSDFTVGSARWIPRQINASTLSGAGGFGERQRIIGGIKWTGTLLQSHIAIIVRIIWLSDNTYINSNAIKN
jgi:hypothetical protein